MFLTVTFSILSILTDHDFFGSDVEQDCSYTVFAVFFLALTKHCRVGLKFFFDLSRESMRVVWARDVIG